MARRVQPWWLPFEYKISDPSAAVGLDCRTQDAEATHRQLFLDEFALSRPTRCGRCGSSPETLLKTVGVRPGLSTDSVSMYWEIAEQDPAMKRSPSTRRRVQEKLLAHLERATLSAQRDRFIEKFFEGHDLAEWKAVAANLRTYAGHLAKAAASAERLRSIALTYHGEGSAPSGTAPNFWGERDWATAAGHFTKLAEQAAAAAASSSRRRHERPLEAGMRFRWQVVRLLKRYGFPTAGESAPLIWAAVIEDVLSLKPIGDPRREIMRFKAERLPKWYGAIWNLAWTRRPLWGAKSLADPMGAVCTVQNPRSKKGPLLH